MHPIAIQAEGGAPRFAADPAAWAEWVRDRLRHDEASSLAALRPGIFEGRDGHRWRVVNTDGGIEIRPDLGTLFLRANHNPQISAIQIGGDVVIELCSVEGRWIGRFELDELDLRELVRAMVAERHLPHDNLRLLFGRGIQ